MTHPIKNMRVQFWGVQGSCPYFPAPHEVQEYTRRIALDTLSKAFDDLMKHSGTAHPVETVLGGPPSPEVLAAYQLKLGLTELPVYGGETTCVEVETNEGNVLIFDGGSGIRHCSTSLLERWANKEERTLHVFGSHQHLDHRAGLPFAGFCFAKERPFKINIYSTQRFLRALDEHFGIFSHSIGDATHRDDPLDYTIMSARFKGTEIREEGDATEMPPFWSVHSAVQPIEIGRTRIQPFLVYHSDTPCMAYRVQHDDAVFVFCTDHEHRRGLDLDDPRQKASNAAEERLQHHAREADLLYIDGQYFTAEYMGLQGIGATPAVSRMDWGHGIIEECVERSFQLKIKQTLIGHHDPGREWPTLVQTDRELANLCKGKECRVELARSSTIVEI